MLLKAINSVTTPSSVTRSTRLGAHRSPGTHHVLLHRVLNARRDEERRAGRMALGEGPDVRNNADVPPAVHAVDAVDVAAADVSADRMTRTKAVLPMKATSMAPPMAPMRFGKPIAKVETSPVRRSTREILPAPGSGTSRAPSGPMVLPEPPPTPKRTGRLWETGNGTGHSRRPA